MNGPGIPGYGGYIGPRLPRPVEVAEVVELVEPPEWVEAHRADGHDCATCERRADCEIGEVMAAWQRGESVPRPVVEAAEQAGRAHRIAQNPFLRLLAQLAREDAELERDGTE